MTNKPSVTGRLPRPSRCRQIAKPSNFAEGLVGVPSELLEFDYAQLEARILATLPKGISLDRLHDVYNITVHDEAELSPEEIRELAESFLNDWKKQWPGFARAAHLNLAEIDRRRQEEPAGSGEGQPGKDGED